MDQVMGMLGGQGSEGQKDIVGAFSSLLGGEGGLQGLIDQLDGNGLTEEVSSWVSTGQNKAVDPAPAPAGAAGPGGRAGAAEVRPRRGHPDAPHRGRPAGHHRHAHA